jgi:hypothetical protein
VRTAALERIIRRADDRRVGRPNESCALCAVELPEDHAHMFDTEAQAPLCVCTSCSILFNRAAASEGHYRLVPDRRLPLTGVEPAMLRVPVGLAFFVVGEDGRTRAHYPSPAGATRWEVDEGDWRAVVDCCPDLGSLAYEVEALLVNTARGHQHAWIVPVSDCYRLVALVRTHWEGLSGGDRVWQAIDEFFDQLRRSDGSYSRR